MTVLAHDPLSLLLPRLQNVRQSGKGYRADCPNGHTSRGTLSITQGDNGNVLLHCFADCTAAQVVAAAGLELADLFPERLTPSSPDQIHALRMAAKQSGWAAALGVLKREATVIEIAAESIARGGKLTDEDVARVHEASDRIHDAREVLASV